MNITIPTFNGIAPRTSPRLLSSTQAQTATNTKLWSGVLRSYRGDTLVEDVSTEVPYTIHKYKRDDTARQWLAFPNEVNIVDSPIADQETGRAYITGIGDHLRTFDSTTVALTDDTITEDNSIMVQIERPSTIAIMSGDDSDPDINEDPVIEESRTYAYTYVRVLEDGKIDEGGIGVPAQTEGGSVALDLKFKQKAIISNIALPELQGESGITHIALYRSSVNSDGVATYRLVEQFTLAPQDLPEHISYDFESETYTYVDSKKGEDLGVECSSLTWDVPPEGLRGLISLNNGTLVGFKGKTVYFSVPHQAHAWPYGQSVTADQDIVGLGAFGDTVVACTTEAPILISAQDPTLLIALPVSEHAPCLSARSIVSLNGAVVYASPNGLVSVDTAMPTLITQQVVDKETWANYRPETMHGHFHRGFYYGLCQGVYNGGIVVDAFNMGNGTVELSNFCSSGFVDPETDELYLAYKYGQTGRGGIYKFDSDPAFVPAYTWRSKVFTSNVGVSNLSAARVDVTKPLPDPEPPVHMEITKTCFNNNPVNTFAINGDNGDYERSKRKITSLCRFNYYVDGKLAHTKLVYNSRPFRLPAGTKGHNFEVEVISTTEINRIQVTQSMPDLM